MAPSILFSSRSLRGYREDTLQQSAAMLGRLHDATEAEIEAAIVTVRAALDHPVMRRAAAQPKGGLRREAPVLLKLEGGSLAEGVIDLLYREDGREFTGWTVVDFKTDREFAAYSEHYVKQVRLYAQAIESVTASPARGVLLIV
jgi:ATP-dependent helicase/nuclease subunit A